MYIQSSFDNIIKCGGFDINSTYTMYYPPYKVIQANELIKHRNDYNVKKNVYFLVFYVLIHATF